MNYYNTKDRLNAQIWDALHTVQDPELCLDIVNLGLVYEVQLKPASEAMYAVIINMTLTSPTCPMAPYILQSVHEAIKFLDGVASVDVNLVWDPPWSSDRISEEGKMELGLL